MRTAAPIEIGPLDPTTADAVRALADAAAAADGVAPLSEQPLLRLTTDHEDLTHVVARTRHGVVVGYAQVDRGGRAASAELVVHPEHRRQGVGRVLLRTAELDATLPARSGEPGGHDGLRVWAHGDLPAARGLAAAAGYAVVRELLLLARDLPVADAAAPAVPPVPDGLRLRPSVPGADDAAWLALNARAFASHPEQGRLAQPDLEARQAEDWFDPAGLLLLERVGPGTTAGAAGGLVGAVWTKVPTGQPDDARDGELYVVAVDPDAQGQGLGALLTQAALAHLARAGVRRAVLYVDGDNTAAVRTYERAGFARAAVDVQYARPAQAPAAG